MRTNKRIIMAAWLAAGFFLSDFAELYPQFQGVDYAGFRSIGAKFAEDKERTQQYRGIEEAENNKAWPEERNHDSYNSNKARIDANRKAMEEEQARIRQRSNKNKAEIEAAGKKLERQQAEFHKQWQESQAQMARAQAEFQQEWQESRARSEAAERQIEREQAEFQQKRNAAIAKIQAARR